MGDAKAQRNPVKDIIQLLWQRNKPDQQRKFRFFEMAEKMDNDALFNIAVFLRCCD